MSSDPIQYGEVKASYFWDDGSGINGDTGAPASGKPMQKGMAASPSWPLGTEGYVEYNGKKAEFFIGDRGPGFPAENCDVLLDLDGKTFAELVGSSWNDSSYTVASGQGHIDVEYYITEWGDGAGTPGAPQPMSGSEVCDGEAVQPVPASAKDGGDQKQQPEESSEQDSSEQAASEESADGGEDEKSAQQKAEDSADDGSQSEQAAEDGQSGAASGGDSGDGGSGKGLTAETAANDVSGISLAGNDLPLAAGVLTLAIVPALLVALLFARRSRAVDYAGAHRSSSLLSAAGMRETVQSVRERIPGSWAEAKSAAGGYWERAARAVRERGSPRGGQE
ncbi:hypothetical protein [Streptomonospora sp. PA3]|uniref:hypothetical protein n=1 Tax=Streptomonospora sp. PA3 TaxID=2607326 RepID=UPI001642C90F|nr:hypothetical protein [Streptomonospora sp. PA3]